MPTVELPTTSSAIQIPPTIRKPEIWNRITLCGEAGGRQEAVWHECPQCHTGLPHSGRCLKCGSNRVFKPQGFVGGAGNVLRKICKSAGVEFDRCNLTNVVKKRPPNDDFGIFYNDPKKRTQPKEELLWWRELLRLELEKYRPNVLVALGNEALKAVTSCTGITKWRGSLLQSPSVSGIKIIPSVHPAWIMRDNWEFYYISIRDFKRVAQESSSTAITLKEPEDEFIIGPRIEEAVEWLRHIQESKAPWYIDIETRGDTLTCLGISSDSRRGKAICIPIQTTTGPYWSVDEEATVWRELSLAMGRNPYLRNQNIVYDLDYLLDHGCEPSGVDFDPMVGMNVAYPEFPKGLDFTTSIYTYYPYYKDEGKTWKRKVPDKKVWEYNCKDMVSTPKVTDGVKKDLGDSQLSEVCQKRSIAMLPIAIEMQRNRLRLNRDWHSKLAGLLMEERFKVHSQLTELLSKDINVKSSPQVQKVIYEVLRLPVKKKRATGNVTTAENELKELRAEYPECDILTLILKERHLRTKESNYINVKFDNDPDGTMHLGYMAIVGGTKTGRWSFSRSPKWRGSSPQVVSNVMRLMYEPPPGSVFWQRDLSQAEARVVAQLADCKFLLDVFANGKIKIHKLVGGKIFRKDPLDIEDGTLEYDTAKSIVHAYNYMVQYKRLAVEANVSNEFAREVLRNYGSLVPEIDNWHNSIKETVIKTGRLVTPMGRVRVAFKSCSVLTHTGQLPDDYWRDLVSYIPQSTVPDILNEGMLNCWSEMPWARWHQQGHDSYLASGDPKRTGEFFEKSEAFARVPFVIKGTECIIPSEFKWGYLWGALLKYKPGEDTSYEAWKQRCEEEKDKKGRNIFDEKRIKENLYSLF